MTSCTDQVAHLRTLLLADNPPNHTGRPSVCRNCGALIGAGETACHVCGAPLQPARPPPLPLHERYAMSYARAILSRPYIFTIVFLVANFFVFLLMWEASGCLRRSLWAAFQEGVLLSFGAKTNYTIRPSSMNGGGLSRRFSFMSICRTC